MTVHKFTIDFNGKKEPVEYEDDMAFGTFEKIIRDCADMTDESKLVKNVQEYRKAILLAAFEPDDEALRRLTDYEQIKYQLYTICATQFGWDKKKVDDQPWQYLKYLLLTYKVQQGLAVKPGVPIGDQRVVKPKKKSKRNLNKR